MTKTKKERGAVKMAAIDSNTIMKGIETMNNVSKLAVNMSNLKSAEASKPKDPDNLNQPHNQTVEVKVGGGESVQKPMVIHEKKETHIHKPFPEGRALSDAECEIEKMRLQLDYDDKKAEREYRIWLEEQNRKDRKEREENAKREREERKKSDRKFLKGLLISAGIACAAGLGCSALSYYADSRSRARSGLAFPSSQVRYSTNSYTTPDPVKVEGTVK